MPRRRSEPSQQSGRTAPDAETLWRSDARDERVEVVLSADGGLKLRHSRTPRSAREAWGPDAYEATLEIPRDDVTDLAVMLLKAGFADQPDALEALRIFCERRGVGHKYAIWS